MTPSSVSAPSVNPLKHLANNILILGPCAAESYEQVWVTAQALVRMGRPFIFRAGIWKPRTSPQSFQGIGEQGLTWLIDIQRQLSIKVATEVATPDQMTKALNAGIDYLWIGARTTTNPILVQQLADTLVQSVFRPKAVIVKNPVNNDVQLWMGAISRFAGIVPVYAVHRGCNHRPCWDMAYALRRELPDIPLLMDPSHMSGQKEMIQPLCLTAAQLNYDGLMVEVHPYPEKALSDAPQQVTPDYMAEILGSMPTNADDNPLSWMRKIMDEVDDELWQTLLKRMDVSKQIGDYKQKQGISVIQPKRYEEILERRLVWGEKNGMDSKLIKDIFERIHSESVRLQNNR